MAKKNLQRSKKEQLIIDIKMIHLFLLAFLFAWGWSVFSKTQRVQTTRAKTSLSVKQPTQALKQKSSSQPKTRTVASTQKTQTDYPPPPKDKTQLPAPIQTNIQTIAHLCRISTLAEQVSSIKEALAELNKAIDFYLENHFYQVKSGKLVKISMSLFGGDMEFSWGNLNSEHRSRIVDEFLHHRIYLYKLYENAGPESFTENWEHQIYRGLYCLSHGRPPPKNK